jgi:hypothetical protein
MLATFGDNRDNSSVSFRLGFVLSEIVFKWVILRVPSYAWRRKEVVGGFTDERAASSYSRVQDQEEMVVYSVPGTGSLFFV